jgi:dTDP-4-amino-4,6-dideoxygalactose transaminase
VGVASGLDALYLGLRALDVGPGDEVIVPSNTYIATWLAVSMCGAIPVPVEPENDTFNMDSTRIEAAITPATKVILPVHLYGQPADLDPILAIARKFGLFVLEDAAQAHGSRYRGTRIGGHGDVVVWSFYPSKNLGCFGDGGAITTNNVDIVNSIKTLRNYGSSVKNINQVKGVNSRLDSLQAAVLRVKLKHLDNSILQRTSIAKKYIEQLAFSDLVLPNQSHSTEHSWHLFVVRSEEREKLQYGLKKGGVETQIHYPIPPHLQKAFAELGFSRGDFPIAESMHESVLSLPLYPSMQNFQVDKVIECCLSVVRN